MGWITRSIRSRRVDPVSGGASSGEHAFFDALSSRSDYVQSFSLRPIAGHTSTSDPYYESQLTSSSFFAANTHYHPPVYDSTVQAARYDVRHFGGVADGHATKNLLTDIDSTTLTLVLDATPASIYNANKHLRILRSDSSFEVMEIASRTGSTITIKSTGRACFGTTASSHAAGTEVQYTIMQINGNDQLRIPMSAPKVDGDRYCWIWEDRLDATYQNTGLVTMKTYQIAGQNGGSQSQFWEPRWRFDGGVNPTTPGWNSTTHVTAVDARRYAPLASSGNEDAFSPQGYTDRILLYPNEWARWWVEVLMSTTSSGTRTSMWVATARDGVHQIYDDIVTDISDSTKYPNLSRFWVEIGISQENTTQLAANKGWPNMVSWHRNVALLKPTSTSYRAAVMVTTSLP